MPSTRPSLPTSLLAISALLVTVLTACGSKEEGPTEHYYRVDTEEGVTAYITSGVPKYTDPLFTYEETVYLVQDESRPETLLSSVYGYQLGDDGFFYVPDRGNDRIAVFDAEGNYSHDIGREGDGPGEFRSPQLLWIGDGKVAVYDGRHRRTSLFTYGGEFLKSYSVGQTGFSSTRLYPLEDGRIVASGSRFEPQPDRSMLRWYAGTVLSAEGDTLAEVESPRRKDEPPIMLEEYGIGIGRMMYFEPRHALTYVYRRGFLRYWSGEPILRWYDLEGQLSSLVRIEKIAEPVTEKDRKSILDSLRKSADEAEEERDKALRLLMIKHAEFSDTKSFFVSVSVDDYGYYWLVDHPDYSSTDPFEVEREMMVLSPEGEYLGNTVFVNQFGSVSRGHLLTVEEAQETGEMDYIVYRIVSAIPGFEYP